MSITDIIDLRGAGGLPHTPPPTDYGGTSPRWREVERRHFDRASGRVVTGFWEGAPGWASLDPWPYTEICFMLTGRVAVRDADGAERVFGPGDAFLVPKGFAGVWVTLESATKIFVAID